MVILDRVASPEERAEYRRSMLALAEATGTPPPQTRPAATRPRNTDHVERDALRSITAIFDR